MRKCVILSVLLFLLSAGCGDSSDKPRFTQKQLATIPFPQKGGLPEASGGIVLTVSGETVTSQEIVSPLVEHFKPLAQTTDIERFKIQARGQLEPFITNKIANILLYQKAKAKAGENIDEALEKATETEVKKFIARFEGDYAMAEEALKEMGLDWQSFNDYQRRMILSQSFISSELPEDRPATYSELIAGYDKLKDKLFVIPAVLEFQLIDIEAAKLEVVDPNKPRQQQAEELADELMGRLTAGEDFGELARKYSCDHRRDFGGLWKPVDPNSLAEPYDILASCAKQTAPGGIAGPIKTAEHIFIMKLINRQEKSFEPFEKVQREVEANVMLERRKEAVDQFSNSFLQQVTLEGKNDFVNYCLDEIYRRANQ